MVLSGGTAETHTMCLFVAVCQPVALWLVAPGNNIHTALATGAIVPRLLAFGQSCGSAVLFCALPVLQAGTSPNVPSPTLAPSLVDAAHALLGLAHSCAARVQVLAGLSPAVQPQLQQLAAAALDGPLAAAQQQLAAVGSQLLSPAGVQWGSEAAAQRKGLGLSAALAAAAALDALQRAAAVEGLAAVAVLRITEVGQRGARYPAGTF